MARISHGTLVANVIKKVSCAAYTTRITVVNRSQTGEIYFTIDGTDPSIGGDDSNVALGTTTVPTLSPTAACEIRLLSSAALNYSVIGESV
jgi:hypothetical protein